MDTEPHRDQLAKEAKAIVALAFRNGLIENVHAGKPCPVCEGKSEFSHISDREMRLIMKNAVDQVYALLCLKKEDPAGYRLRISFAQQYTTRWDEPGPLKDDLNH